MGKANEDEIVLMGQQQQQQTGLIRTIPIQINSHLIFIDDDIGDPSTYRDVIHCLATWVIQIPDLAPAARPAAPPHFHLATCLAEVTAKMTPGHG